MTFSFLLALQGAHEQNADITNERSSIYSVFSLLLNLLSVSQILSLQVFTTKKKFIYLLSLQHLASEPDFIESGS